MADDIDRANATIDAEMKARLRALPTFAIPSLLDCHECGDEIPSKRRAIGGVTLCIDCQTVYEKRK